MPEVWQTLMTPLALSGSVHCTTTVLELTGRARTRCGGLVGAGRIIHYLDLHKRISH